MIYEIKKTFLRRIGKAMESLEGHTVDEGDFSGPWADYVFQYARVMACMGWSLLHLDYHILESTCETKMVRNSRRPIRRPNHISRHPIRRPSHISRPIRRPKRGSVSLVFHLDNNHTPPRPSLTIFVSSGYL